MALPANAMPYTYVALKASSHEQTLSPPNQSDATLGDPVRVHLDRNR